MMKELSLSKVDAVGALDGLQIEQWAGPLGHSRGLADPEPARRVEPSGSCVVDNDWLHRVAVGFRNELIEPDRAIVRPARRPFAAALLCRRCGRSLLLAAGTVGHGPSRWPDLVAPVAGFRGPAQATIAFAPQPRPTSRAPFLQTAIEFP